MEAQLRNDLDDLEQLLTAAREYAASYLCGLDSRPVAASPPDNLPPLSSFAKGQGAIKALEVFRREFDSYLSASPGPRYLGFVVGGTTPAALIADWLVSAFDQNATLSGDTIAPHVEQQALNALRDACGLSREHTGICVTGATVSNFTGLAIGRQWLGERRGLDLARQGIHAMAPIHVLSGSAHSSVLKALSMLGIGDDAVEEIACIPGTETVDIDALERRLHELKGKPVIVVGNAGVVNNGEFDDLAALARLKRDHEFWFHVDGAFGLLAALSPQFAHLTKGVEAADSVTIDGHKWLNVPYDAGYLFTRHLNTQLSVFRNSSPYLGAPLPDPRNTVHLGPENSRRWRALPLWFTLVAYGKEGIKEIIERNCDLARRFGAIVESLPNYKLVAPVKLNIACFTLADAPTMDDVKSLQKRLLESGEVVVTPSVYLGKPILRAAFSNWRTEDADIERLREVLAAAALR